MTGLLKRLRKILPNLGVIRPASHQQSAQAVPQLSKPSQRQLQNVGVVDINPRNLMTTLRRRYGDDGFEVHVRMAQFTDRSSDANLNGCR